MSNTEITDSKKHITNRIKFSAEWIDAGKSGIHQELAEKHIYIRTLGDGFRAISIHPDNPCGQLKGQDDTEIKQDKQIQVVLALAKDAKPAHTYKPGANKKEHRIQASIIHHAMLNQSVISQIFSGFGHIFDELFFVTDELRFGEIRADIIALARQGEVYFPVFIELKVKRALTELVRQLTDIRSGMSIPDVTPDFITFLETIIPAAKGKINFDANKLLIIWPQVNSKESPSVEEARQQKGILTSYFTESTVNGYHFTLENPQ